MSDASIHIFPTDPTFVPDDSAQAAAEAILKDAVSKDSEITSETEEHIVFRDCGANFESVTCPHCNAEVPLDLWGELMSSDYDEDRGFMLRPHKLPCCSRAANLNELAYTAVQGFSRYVLNVMNPGAQLLDDVIVRLAQTLQCELKIVHQHL